MSFDAWILTASHFMGGVVIGLFGIAAIFSFLYLCLHLGHKFGVNVPQMAALDDRALAKFMTAFPRKERIVLCWGKYAVLICRADHEPGGSQ